jgi:hypothetical protein
MPTYQELLKEAEAARYREILDHIAALRRELGFSEDEDVDSSPRLSNPKHAFDNYEEYVAKAKAEAARYEGRFQEIKRRIRPGTILG